MGKAHHRLSPSSFNPRSQCPQFVSAPAGAAAQRGTWLHAGGEALLRGNELSEDYTGEDREQVEWYADYVKMVAGDLPLEVEVQVSCTDEDDFSELYFGTLDAVAYDAPRKHVDICDMKSGERRNYWPQMFSYATAISTAREIESIRCHVVYPRMREVDTYDTTPAEARQKTMAIIESIERGDPPRACDYCNWCEKSTYCPAITDQVTALAEVDQGVPELPPFDPHMISDPAMMSKALVAARYIETWVSGVKRAADGFEELPGFSKSAVNRRSIRDVGQAFHLLGLPPEKFLSACKLTLGQLEKQFAEHNDMKAGAAKTAVREILEPITEIKTSNSFRKQK